MLGDKVASDFMEAIAEKVAAMLLPQVVEALKSELGTKENVTMDVNEAAAYIGISKELLYKLCAANGIPHLKLSSSGSGRARLLFNSESLDRWKREEEQRNFIRKVD